MAKKFYRYQDYADATLQDIFDAGQLKDAHHLTANVLATTFFERGNDGKFHVKELPVQAQFSPVFTITPFDYDNDGNEDVLLCGNINHARLRFGNSDANYGVLLKGDGKGHFTYINQLKSGLSVTGDVRSVINIKGLLIFNKGDATVKLRSQ